TRSLSELRAEAHCAACNIAFDASFDRLVEVRFSPSPAVRAVENREFCMGGPMNRPHILAQVPLAPGERQNVLVQVGSGLFKLLVPGVEATGGLEVSPEAGHAEASLAIRADGPAPGHVTATPGEVTLQIVNELPRPTVLLVSDTR